MITKVRLERKLRGYTAAKLSAETGIDPGTLSCLETGKRTMTRTNALRLAAAFNMDTEDVFELTEEVDERDALLLA